MKICLLTNQELDKLPLPDGDWPCDPRPFYKKAKWHVETLEKQTSTKQIKKLMEQDFDLFFNLCDGSINEDDNPGIEVTKTLEKHKQAFTGASSNFFEPTRKMMKQVCKKHNIKTPKYFFAKDEADTDKVLANLEFPMIVKHFCSYASIDISRNSRVVTKEGLKRQVRKICRKHGRALIEKFIEGDECTVLVSEDFNKKPITYIPIQYTFPKGESFKHEKIKWKDFDKIDAAPVRDEKLNKQLRKITSAFFAGINGVSFGRCDFRVNKEGIPFLLEINPNCGIYYPPSAPASADLCLLNEKSGHKKFTEQIIKTALLRHKNLY